jgi:sRNA-binding protein
MMASRKSEAGVSRPKQKPTKQIGMMQFVLVGAGIIVLIVVALLLSGGGRKKAVAPRAKVAVADTGSTYGKATKSPAVAAHRTKASRRDSLMAKRREERLQRKQEVKASGGRTTRTSSGGFTSRGSARAASAPNQLRAILTDNAGSRTALVGERRLKAGDDVEGHRIVEVSGDGVKVEYRQNTYTVRVGEKIY